MRSEVDARSVHRPRSFPFHRVFPQIVRDPVRVVRQAGAESAGEIIRLDLGLFRPYLVTHPDHVQQVLRDRAASFPREGMMWKPLRRLVGEISGEGPAWAFNREIFQNLLTGKNIATFTDDMAEAIEEGVAELTARMGDGRPFDSSREMVRIIHRAVIRAFFGNKIAVADADRLGPAIKAITTSFGFRMLFPFVPASVPLPGDRAVNRSVAVINEVIYPIIERCRRDGSEGDDLISKLLRARVGDRALTDKEIRDGVVAMFVSGTETTATALTWLWTALEANPDVAAGVQREIDEVIGDEPPRRGHLPELRYTKMVLMELVRRHPVGWIIPRTCVRDEVIGGVLIKKGSTVLISPYLTHRLPQVWPDPETFDPERFAPGRHRHRFAYLAFGAGPHQCVGNVFFYVEAQLILASLLRRHRISVVDPSGVHPQVGLTLQPRDQVQIMLRAAEHAPR